MDVLAIIIVIATAYFIFMNSLSSNKVGDRGATAISSTLERVTRLITLEYVNC